MSAFYFGIFFFNQWGRKKRQTMQALSQELKPDTTLGLYDGVVPVENCCSPIPSMRLSLQHLSLALDSSFI